MPTAEIRREIHFEGRVQGVGFRQTTRSIATGFPVVGFVQNLPDGRVRLVAEGSSVEVDRFVAAVQNELNRYIRDMQTDDSPAVGEFKDFDIRY
jgi:acylphosphatase